MSIRLYPHNTKAYKSAVKMMEQAGKAAVIHPTGTGKSFIGFKLAEDHPDSRILWLSPSKYIFHTQKENYIKSGGTAEALRNVTFSTYAKLMWNEESIDIKGTDYIILDEFHRCGAAEWGKSVSKLLNSCPSAKVLGLSATNVRYLDNQRDMAEEIFEGHVASRLSLGEAISMNVLPAPTYVISLYSYGEELKKLAKRVEALKNREARKQSEELLEKLRRSLQSADGPEKIFKKHMKPDGKYLVFCSGKEHMDEMMELSDKWFFGLDKEPHIYQVYYDNNESRGQFKAFCGDESGHLKLLYCIDMLNEGIHVGNIDGVILLRPTISPILYLQQVGRALSAARDGKPVIFDIVNNFDSLYCIDSLQEEIEEAFCAIPESRRGLLSERFQIIDEIRDCREIFDQLQRSLTSSWDIWYQEAKKFHSTYNHLRIPKGYVTENGLALGNWILTQRKVRQGKVSGILTEEQIAKLDILGMVWENVSDHIWLTAYEELKEYVRKQGSADVIDRYRTETGFALGRWVSRQRKLAAENALEEEKIKLLNEVGFVWNKKEQNWSSFYAAARAYYCSRGDLDIPVNYCTKDGLRLGRWVRMQRCNAEHLSEEKREALEQIGICWENCYDNKFEEKYQLAEAYFKEHGNLEVPVNYTIDGIRLGKWISNMRIARQDSSNTNYQLTEERIRRLSGIGMIWESSWDIRFRLAESYYHEHGNLRIPQTYVTTDRIWLGKWIVEQRKKYHNNNGRKRLTATQIQKLNSIGMDWEITKDLQEKPSTVSL